MKQEQGALPSDAKAPQDDSAAIAATPTERTNAYIQSIVLWLKIMMNNRWKVLPCKARKWSRMMQVMMAPDLMMLVKTPCEIILFDIFPV
jgi:hypothetical protein